MTEIRVLNQNEIDQVSGGFVCGGLCIAAAFTGGVLVGGAITHLIFR